MCLTNLASVQAAAALGAVEALINDLHQSPHAAPPAASQPHPQPPQPAAQSGAANSADTAPRLEDPQNSASVWEHPVHDNPASQPNISSSQQATQPGRPASTSRPVAVIPSNEPAVKAGIRNSSDILSNGAAALSHRQSKTQAARGKATANGSETGTVHNQADDAGDKDARPVKGRKRAPRKKSQQPGKATSEPPIHAASATAAANLGSEPASQRSQARVASRLQSSSAARLQEPAPEGDASGHGNDPSHAATEQEPSPAGTRGSSRLRKPTGSWWQGCTDAPNASPPDGHASPLHGQAGSSKGHPSESALPETGSGDQQPDTWEQDQPIDGVDGGPSVNVSRPSAAAQGTKGERRKLSRKASAIAAVPETIAEDDELRPVEPAADGRAACNMAGADPNGDMPMVNDDDLDNGGNEGIDRPEADQNSNFPESTNGSQASKGARKRGSQAGNKRGRTATAKVDAIGGNEVPPEGASQEVMGKRPRRTRRQAAAAAVAPSAADDASAAEDDDADHENDVSAQAQDDSAQLADESCQPDDGAAAADVQDLQGQADLHEHAEAPTDTSHQVSPDPEAF